MILIYVCDEILTNWKTVVIWTENEYRQGVCYVVYKIGNCVRYPTNSACGNRSSTILLFLRFLLSFRCAFRAPFFPFFAVSNSFLRFMSANGFHFAAPYRLLFIGRQSRELPWNLFLESLIYSHLIGCRWLAWLGTRFQDDETKASSIA